MTYTDNFLKLYKNIRSAFSGKLYNTINDEDILKMYVLEYSLREYYQINSCEENIEDRKEKTNGKL